MKATKELLTSYTIEKSGRPTSRRSDLIQSIADAIDVPFKNVFNEVWHLKDDWGCDVLQMILDDVLRTGDNVTYRALMCRKMIDKSKK